MDEWVVGGRTEEKVMDGGKGACAHPLLCLYIVISHGCLYFICAVLAVGQGIVQTVFVILLLLLLFLILINGCQIQNRLLPKCFPVHEFYRPYILADQ